MLVVGIDGTKGGWVAIALEDGRVIHDDVIQPVETEFKEFDEIGRAHV